MSLSSDPYNIHSLLAHSETFKTQLLSTTSLAALAAGMGIILIQYFDEEEELNRIKLLLKELNKREETNDPV